MKELIRKYWKFVYKVANENANAYSNYGISADDYAQDIFYYITRYYNTRNCIDHALVMNLCKWTPIRTRNNFVRSNGKEDICEDVYEDVETNEYYSGYEDELHRRQLLSDIINRIESDRNRDIFEMFLKGNYKKSIGKKHGISKERVRQIIEKIRENSLEYVKSVEMDGI